MVVGCTLALIALYVFYRGYKQLKDIEYDV